MDYDFTVRIQGDYWLKTYLHQNSERQTIEFDNRLAPQPAARIDENEIVIWEGANSGSKKIEFGFKYTARPVTYNISGRV